MKRNWLLTIAWLLGRYILMEMERYGTSQLESTVFLRFVSRLAIAFRVTRVIINLRKARKLSGFFTKSIQIAVSQNRRRYTKSGFNLDLTYITDRVIAMSAPCFGAHTSYRNDIHVVSRFLSLRHYGCFLVFNLCDTFMSSDGVIGNYHPQMLFNQVQRIPFEDHCPPLITEMIFFCEQVCVCVRERVRGRDRERAVCVCVRERECERESVYAARVRSLRFIKG
jgi:hypothetical protein